MITKEEFIEYLRRINRLSSIEFDSPELRRLFKLDFYSTTTDKTVLNLLYEKIRLYSKVESELRSFANALGAEDKYEIVNHLTSTILI